MPPHSLTHTRIVEQLSNSQNLSRMLADYRAKGGRIRQREAHDPFSTANTVAPVSNQNRAGDGTVKPPAKADNEDEKLSKQSEMNWVSKVSSVEIIFHQ